MIQPGAITQFTGDPGALETAITKLAAAGREIVNGGAAIDTTWQRLDAVYDAPEAGPLFAATSRVRDNAANLGEDVEAVPRVLTTYLAEVQGVAAKLANLKTAAATFVAGSQSDPDWRENDQKVDQHNDLVRQVDVETAALMAAERKAANAIYALIGGPEYHDVAGTPFSYGFDAADLARTADRPWGDPVDRERPWWIDVSAGAYNLSKGIVWDGVINGDLRGFANLFGYFGEGWLEDGKVFDLETAKETWTGLGMLAWALAGTNPCATHWTESSSCPVGRSGWPSCRARAWASSVSRPARRTSHVVLARAPTTFSRRPSPQPRSALWASSPPVPPRRPRSSSSRKPPAACRTRGGLPVWSA